MNRMRVMGEKGVRNFLVTHQKSWLQNSRCKTFPAEYDKSLSRNSFYETFWLFLKKVYHETFSTEPFFTCFKKKFITKPLVRNLFDRFQTQVLCETSCTELLFCVQDNGLVEYRNFYETKKGSSPGYTGRTIISSVELLFFLECIFHSYFSD